LTGSEAPRGAQKKSEKRIEIKVEKLVETGEGRQGEISYVRKKREDKDKDFGKGQGKGKVERKK
jgi:hypothetical protein